MKNRLVLTVAVVLFISSFLFSQNFKLSPNDTLTSVVIHPDHSVTFEIYAPNAEKVWLGGSDIPDLFHKGKMTKLDDGVWRVTIDSIEPGAYRYNFNVDGVSVLDPRNPNVSESNMNAWSLVYIPGKAYMDTQNVPHGAVSSVTYYSNSLKKFRRMHVYTPPGYDKNNKSYPVLYLLNGAFDCDDSWPTVGRAGFIIDNLIAEKKVVPMIVVMPDGHTGPFRFGMPFNATVDNQDGFVVDFNNDIKPYIDDHYRIINKREDCAIAGLSMGGSQTLNIAIPHLNEFAYIGVFSSGVLGIISGSSFGKNVRSTWEKKNKKYLENDELKKGLKEVWFATGKDDFLLKTSLATVDLLKKYNFNVSFKESAGAHTWNNWRDYLHEFAQLLFK